MDKKSSGIGIEKTVTLVKNSLNGLIEVPDISPHWLEKVVSRTRISCFQFQNRLLDK